MNLGKPSPSTLSIWPLPFSHFVVAGELLEVLGPLGGAPLAADVVAALGALCAGAADAQQQVCKVKGLDPFLSECATADRDIV